MCLTARTKLMVEDIHRASGHLMKLEVGKEHAYLSKKWQLIILLETGSYAHPSRHRISAKHMRPMEEHYVYGDSAQFCKSQEAHAAKETYSSALIIKRPLLGVINYVCPQLTASLSHMVGSMAKTLMNANCGRKGAVLLVLITLRDMKMRSICFIGRKLIKKFLKTR